MRLITTILTILFINSSVFASELGFKFHSPSFSGQGKSSHYLTIENIEKTRADAIAAQKKADAKAAKAETDALAVNKFKANLEARFYTALAKQITDNIFGKTAEMVRGYVSKKVSFSEKII